MIDDRKNRTDFWAAGIVIGWIGLFVAAALTAIAVGVIFDQTKKGRNDVADLQWDLVASCDPSKVTRVYVVGGTTNSSSAAFLNGDNLIQTRVIEDPLTSPAEPVWLSAETQVWLVDTDNNRITVYDSLSRRQIDIVSTSHFGCSAPMSPSYNAEAGQVWVSCRDSKKFLVFSSADRALIADVPVTPNSLDAGRVTVGADYAVAILYPDHYAVYSTANPLAGSTAYTIPGATNFDQLWYGDHGSDSRLYIYAASTSVVYQIEWGAWAPVAGNSATLGSVLDMTTTPNEKRLYVVSAPNLVHTLDTSTMNEASGSPTIVPEQDAVSIGASIDGDSVLVGSSYGIVFKYDVDSSTHALLPTAVPSTFNVKTSPNYEPNGRIVGANLGCPCNRCNSLVAAGVTD